MELAKLWSGLEYTNGIGTTLAQVVSAKIEWPSLRLTDGQQTTLKKRLSEVFAFLGNPNFQDYYGLKTKGLTWELELNKLSAKLLARTRTETNGSTMLAPKETLKALWEIVNAQPESKKPPRIAGIGVKYVRAATSSTNSSHTILNGKVGVGLTVASEAIEPGFRYGGQTNAVSSETAQGLFFHLSLFARSDTSTNAGPLYLSVYWSEPDQNWALSRLFADTLLDFHTMF